MQACGAIPWQSSGLLHCMYPPVCLLADNCMVINPHNTARVPTCRMGGLHKGCLPGSS
jgi:hypothetical protein